MVRLQTLLILCASPAVSSALYAQPTLLRVDGRPFYNGFFMINVSNDASIALGRSGQQSGARFLLWEGPANGREFAPPLGASGVAAAHLSDDGSTVLALLHPASDLGWHIGTPDGAMTRLDIPLPGATPTMLSGSGQWAIGTALLGGVKVPLRWRRDGSCEVLEPAAPSLSTELVSLSTDGQWTAGHVSLSDRSLPVLRSPQGRYELLPLPAFAISAKALRVSDDGRVVMGSCRYPYDFHVEAGAWRWTPELGTQVLMSDRYSWSIEPGDMSADGRVIVGRMLVDNNIYRAFIWTQQTGLLDLQHYLTRRGLIAPGLTLVHAPCVSAQGGVIASSEGHVVVGVPQPATSARALPLVSARNGPLITEPWAVAADGEAVVGVSYTLSQTGVPYARRWVFGGAEEEIGFASEPIYGQYLAGVSDDASAVVFNEPQHRESWSHLRLWREGEGVTTLAAAPLATHARGMGISADGRTVLGGVSRYDLSVSSLAPCMWVDAVPYYVTAFDEGSSPRGMAVACSNDRSVVVGMQNSRTGFNVGRWVNGGPFEAYPSIAGQRYAEPRAASHDMRVVVGWMEDQERYVHAARWTRWSAERLPMPIDVRQSEAVGVTADGRAVIGWLSGRNGREAFVWTRELGVQRLNELLARQGYEVSDWVITDVTDISPDGRVIVGKATTPIGDYPRTTAWIVRDMVVPCGWSDVASAGDSEQPDGVLSAEDLVAFVGWFMSGDSRADIAGVGDSAGPDFAITVDDLQLFVGRYVAGCPVN